MTLEQEREMLAMMRAAAPAAFSPESIGGMWETVSGDVAWVDQYVAAAADAKRMLPVLGGIVERGPAMHKPNIDTSPEFTALLVAALVRCIAGHACPHTRSDRPMFVFVGARVMSCRACLMQFAEVVEAQDERVTAGGDSLCDFCLEESEGFRELRVQSGPYLLLADACDDCFELALGES